MTQQNLPTAKTGSGYERLLTPQDAATFLRLSESWLAKARMRGDGPPYVTTPRALWSSGLNLIRDCRRTAGNQSRKDVVQASADLRI